LNFLLATKVGSIYDFRVMRNDLPIIVNLKLLITIKYSKVKTKFNDFPTTSKIYLFSKFNISELKIIAEVNHEFAIFSSISLAKQWIYSPKASTWINLPSGRYTLRHETFTKPIPVIRVDRRAPAMISGFRRRGEQPQYLPEGYDSFKEYNKESTRKKLIKGKYQQAPFTTMVCTTYNSTVLS
jgi:thymidylate synthase ThyX